MRLFVKFTASLLLGIVAIVGVAAWLTWRGELRFFEEDMRLDHQIVADAVTAETNRIWLDQGKAAAMQRPRAATAVGRHLDFHWIDPTDPASGALPPALRDRVLAGEAASVRDATLQHTFVPVHGPHGEPMVLEVREPMADERVFARESRLRQGAVLTGLVLLCAALTAALGAHWVGRPMRALCDAAARIGQGDLDVELPVRGKDEIATLAAAMNRMCRALAQERARVQLESERRAAAMEQLRHADRLATVGRLAAGVAHELGTPLNVVWAQAQTIASGELAGDGVREAAGVIASEAENMTRTIRDLLDFARRRPPNRERVDLVPLADRTLQRLTAMADKRGVKLTLATDPRRKTVVVDPVQLQQVLTNLVVNALQATGAGGSVQVGIAAAPPPDAGGVDGPWYRIDVTDTGSGILPQHLPHLFEPFFTTKGVGEGAGLGLSVAHGIVGENGGRITVDSVVGRGTRFSVLLPGAAA